MLRRKSTYVNRGVFRDARGARSEETFQSMIEGGDYDEQGLLHRARNGDSDAFAALYQHVAPVARRTASKMMRDAHEAEDLVQEAFYTVLRAIQGGGGPEESFLGYVLSTVRRLAFRQTTRQRRVIVSNDVDANEDTNDHAPGTSKQFDDIAAAWAGLPARWQRVLWRLEVDRYSPAELAPVLDMTPNAVSSLATRARDGLRRAYLAQQVADADQQIHGAAAPGSRRSHPVRGRIRPAMSYGS